MSRMFLAALAISASCTVAGPPTAAAPAFEVASIKPNGSGDANRLIRPAGGHLSVSNMTVKDLLIFAYRVRGFQLSGGPGWIDSAHYDIEAKAEGNASADQMRLMLQSLLQDRFKLALHHETKELPIYVLAVAKSGLKIQPLKDGDCVNFDPANPAATQGRKQSDFCGTLGTGRSSLDATKVSMPDLATAFSFIVGRSVVDKTGVAGGFSVHLRFAPDDPAPDPSRPGPPVAADLTGPSIFTAVQEQLGLKLESSKGPVEILVIDSVEKPSEN
jgi:uncharacterized protein (TIGR03435 family)